MKFKKLLALIFLAFFYSPAFAEKILIAAAADLKFAMDEIVNGYKKRNPNDEIQVVYGSSGTFLIQIQQGAPFHLYFSADIEYPRKLVSMSLAKEPVVPYALGRIVIWSNQMDASKMTLMDFKNSSISKIAIANPKHAPYGKRAEEALKMTGVYNDVMSKFVYGENIGQTANWVATGNAQVGIIALSLAMSKEMKTKGTYALIDEKLHQPLEQGYVVTKFGENNQLTNRFAEHMRSALTIKTMESYGFVVPK